MKAEITYLDNSGFVVRTAGHVLVFDCWTNRPAGVGSGFSAGVVDPAGLAADNVYVFASHAHGDHYNPMIFGWRKKIWNIHYILSDDIRGRDGALMVSPGRHYQIDDLQLRTLRSTDEGVAFLAAVDGLSIYHAGDLNWWHWEGEDPQWNADMARDYKAEINRLKGERIDIAFVPVDPRLGESCLLGIRYFMEQVGAKLAVPMHYGSAAAYAARAIETLPAEMREKVAPPMERGQTILFQSERGE